VPRSIQRLPRLPARPRDAHKGIFGRVLVAGGSRGMIGAPALAANAALRSGCGLAHLAVPAPVQLAAAALAPCATSSALAATPDGMIAASAAAGLLSMRADVLALGPGMGRSRAGERLVAALVSRSSVPVVLDADGLNNLSGLPRVLAARRPAALVLTPHPVEAARLMVAADIPLDPKSRRRESAMALARAASAVVVLKGAGSIVTDGEAVFVNRTGNPGMATGGSGDVLTGVIAALIAQGLSPLDAAVLGVHVHGRAGDLAARRVGQVSLIATDLLDVLPAAFRSLSAG